MTAITTRIGGYRRTRLDVAAALLDASDRRRIRYSPDVKSVSWSKSIGSGPVTNVSVALQIHAITGGCQSEIGPFLASRSCCTESHVMNPGKA